MQKLIKALKEVLADGVRRDVEGADLFQGILDNIDWQAPVTPEAPQTFPVVSARLTEACTLAPQGPLERFAKSLLDVHGQLKWNDYYQVYAGEPDIDALRLNYAFTRLCGKGGLIDSNTALIAASLQAPHTFYPSHVHKAREGYIVIGGEAEWQRGGDAFHTKPAGSYFTHPSGVRHATRSLEEPLLCLALWLGDLGSQVVIVRE